jgi:uncharacterized repeat protein (TIGR03803 family)
VHSFDHSRHANTPLGSLIDAGGTLYGTTDEGGAHHAGAVFSMTLGGKAKVLHNFGKGTDGRSPSGSLIKVKGTFYGTTSGGGAHNDGTVFSITTGGTEEVLHSFGPGDGRYPGGYLVEAKGTLYGTTSGGGGSGCGGTVGCGTVFSVTASGTEKVLHDFSYAGHDGTQPAGGLIDVNGTLYGTTVQGGTYGNGTVFALTL